MVQQIRSCVTFKFRTPLTHLLPDNKILDWSKLEQIADDILTLSSIYTHFNTLKKKALGKHCRKR